MFGTDDTIAAIATPPGRGGIGVVRVSGPQAPAIAARLARRDRFAPRHATFTPIADASGEAIDHAVVTHFPAPHSYTGEDVVEISAHGSPVVLQAILAAAVAAGARPAQPGEFTLRAYLHGRIDLVQAEAVADLIDAVTPLQARAAFDQLEGTLTDRIRAFDAGLLDVIARLEASLDFPDEGYHFLESDEARAGLARTERQLDELLETAARGRILRDGLTAAIAGRPNVGKSSLFNHLLGAPRAIVTDIPGTTRDLVAEAVDIAGIRFTLVDTAGVRAAAADPVEAEGIGRAARAIEAADLVVVVLDAGDAPEPDDLALLDRTAARPRLVVAHKSDRPPRWEAETLRGLAALPVSSLTGDGLADLRGALAAAAGAEFRRDRPAVANLRQQEALTRARDAVRRARAAAAERLPEECVITDLYEARRAFDAVVGTRPDDDVLATIFARFCIGK